MEYLNLETEEGTNYFNDHILRKCKYRINDPIGDSIYENLTPEESEEITRLLSLPLKIDKKMLSGEVELMFKFEPRKLIFEKYVPDDFINGFALLGSIHNVFMRPLTHENISSSFFDYEFRSIYHEYIREGRANVFQTLGSFTWILHKFSHNNRGTYAVEITKI